MNISSIIKSARDALHLAGIANSELEARWMLASVLKTSYASLYLREDIPPEAVVIFEEMVERRLNREPIQLIIGEWEFLGRSFYMEKGVFIPRPETEGLVEIIKNRLPKNTPLRGLEIGTGSGVICVSLLCEMPYLSMLGTDISPEAIALTNRNAELHGVADRLDLSGPMFDDRGEFNFIVSNPPYLLSSEMFDLPIEVRFDPPEALDGGIDGLEVIREITKIGAMLETNGFIAIEIHENMAEPTSEVLSESGFKAHTLIDIFGKDRYIIAERR